MAYNVTVSGKEYEGIDKVQLPITGENKKATFYAEASLEDFIAGNIVSFESDSDYGGTMFTRAYAFYGQTKMKTLSLPNLTYCSSYTFQDCTALESVNLPNLATIGYIGTFSGCSALPEIVLPKLKTIGIQAFNNCKMLAKADFPVATKIEAAAFNNCTALEALILRSSTVCDLANINAFLGSGIASGTGYIYVPSALVDSYKAATNWSTYAAQFRAIEDYPDICG